MQLLNKTEIIKSLADKSPDSLFLDPLLEEDQIGEVTIDLRLGYDFLVSILTRKPYMGIATDAKDFRGINSYFQKTRRELGEKFILYPNQVVLTTTLEYVSLPSCVYADVLSRSSYTRLGIKINTMVQPGYRGCLPIELTNQGNNAIELIVGSRVFQARLYDIGEGSDYFNHTQKRKYLANVRPTVSRANFDSDIEKLSRIATES